MKRKFQTILLCSLLTSSVFANPMQGKLISHKESVSPHLKVTYTQIPTNALADSFSMNKSKNHAGSNQLIDQIANVSDKITDSMVNIDNDNPFSPYVFATDKNDIFMLNFTSTESLYTVTHSSCVIEARNSAMKFCTDSTDVIALQPSESYTPSTNIKMSWANVKPGDYYLVFSTSITKNESTFEYTTYDTKLVHIPSTSG